MKPKKIADFHGAAKTHLEGPSVDGFGEGVPAHVAEPAPGPIVRVRIDALRLRRFASEFRAAKDEMESARGSQGAIVKAMEDSLGINRKMFKLAVHLAGLEPPKGADLFRELESCCATLGVFDQAELFDDDDPPALPLAAAE